MNLFRGRRNGERRLAAAAARLPTEGRPPSADRSIELGSTLLTRLDSPALVARATRRGRLSARQWRGPHAVQQPRGGRRRPLTEDGPGTADHLPQGGGAPSLHKALYVGARHLSRQMCARTCVAAVWKASACLTCVRVQRGRCLLLLRARGRTTTSTRDPFATPRSKCCNDGVLGLAWPEGMGLGSTR